MTRRAKRLTWSVTMMVLGATSGVAVAGPTLYVDDDAPAGGDGSSWPTAYRFLHDALVAAADRASGVAEVRVAEGTYVPDRSERHPGGSGDRLLAFVLPDGVAVRGGFLGLGATGGADADERDVERFRTVLSGDLLGDDDGEPTLDNSVHVVWTFQTGPGTAIDGCTIAAGRADIGGSATATAQGGGLFAHFSTVVVTECVFEACYAAAGGGAYGKDGAPRFEGCQFVGNEASEAGGGLYVEDAGEVIACSFAGNVSGSLGGGMYIRGEPTVLGCSFAGNAAPTGGGVAMNGSFLELYTPVLEACAFVGNTATGNGGGLWVGNRFPQVLDCTFTANTADRGGAVRVSPSCFEFFFSGGTFDACSFSENVAMVYGGAFDCVCSEELSVSGCTFADNTAGHAGGAWSNEGSSPLIETSTFERNAVTSPIGEGGAIWNADGSSPTLAGCTLAENHADSGGAVANFLDSSPQIDGCTFDRNAARIGGAVSSFIDCAPLLIGSVFTMNDADEDGGAVWARRADCTATGCSWLGNTARNGGAIWFTEADATLEGCELVGNSAFLWGGGVEGDEAGDLVIVDCAFSANWTQKQPGGAMHLDAETLTIDGSELVGNFDNAVAATVRSVALTGSTFVENEGGYGGPLTFIADTAAIEGCTFSDNIGDAGALKFINDALVSIQDCVFTGNLTTGGIFSGTIYGGRLSIARCAFTGNSAMVVRTSSGAGGTIADCVFEDNSNGIFHEGTTPLEVVRCTFANVGSSVDVRNEATATVRDCTFGPGGGAGVWNLYGGNLTARNSSFHGLNRGLSSFSGGERVAVVGCRFQECGRGIDASSGTLQVVNSVITQCDIAMWLQIGDWRFANCTIVDNAVGVTASSTWPTSGLVLVNSIFRSSPTDAGRIDATFFHCNVEGGWAGPGYANIDADPLFVAPLSGDYRLQAGSACLDAGHNWGVPIDALDLDGDRNARELIPVDLDGLPRFSGDGRRPDAGCGVPVIVDIGAHERQVEPVDEVLFADTDGNLAVDVEDLIRLLAAWGPCGAGCCLSDLDLNRSVDVDDLVTLMLSWG